MELSHAGPMTKDNSRLPGKPEALPGVGCSDLVRLCLYFFFHALTMVLITKKRMTHGNTT